MVSLPRSQFFFTCSVRLVVFRFFFTEKAVFWCCLLLLRSFVQGMWASLLGGLSSEVVILDDGDGTGRVVSFSSTISFHRCANDELDGPSKNG
jgi:hypothetical protein